MLDVPVMNEVLDDPRIREARGRLEALDDHVLSWQAEICAIPAPTGHESRRAAYMADALTDMGLPVSTDGAGNVVARWGDEGGAEVMLAAHLDTVFGPEVDVRVSRHAGRLEGAGISDNARGLAGLLAIAAVVCATRPVLTRPLVFVATVGEEGSGDLRGVKHLFQVDRARPAAFVALDGAGSERIVHRALASQRMRASYSGPGGHSWAAFGVANPAHAAAVAAARVARFEPPNDPRTACSVVRLGGGTGLNSIPQEAWLDFDVRSEDPEALRDALSQVREALAAALDEENRRRVPGTAPLKLELTILGDRPGGVTPVENPLVQAARAATRAIGREPELAVASTDANVPIALGIPAVAVGAGGRAGDAHLATEWYDNADGPLGLFRVLLLAAAAGRG